MLYICQEKDRAVGKITSEHPYHSVIYQFIVRHPKLAFYQQNLPLE